MAPPRAIIVCLWLLTSTHVSITVAAPVAIPTAEPSAPVTDRGWWTSWATCAITPVRTGNPPEGNGGRPTAIPWLLVEPINATRNVLTISLFSGNRPLPVGGTFSNGDNAKWLWQFNLSVSSLHVTAVNEGGTQVLLTQLGPVNTADSSTDWNSLIDLPEPGCWMFSVEATATTGDLFRGEFSFVVVQ